MEEREGALSMEQDMAEHPSLDMAADQLPE
jgi:hypothetical protein